MKKFIKFFKTTQQSIKLISSTMKIAKENPLVISILPLYITFYLHMKFFNKNRYIYIFGPKGAGKTTLAKFLKDPESILHKEYKETVESGKYIVDIKDHESIKLAELEYNVIVVDHPGSVNTRKLPTQLSIRRKILDIAKTEEQPIIFYLFDLNKVDDSNYVKTIKEDLEFISKHLQDAFIIIIANKLDLFIKKIKTKDISKEIAKKIEEIFRQSERKDILKLLKKQNKAAIVSGSLKDKKPASALVAKVFNTLVKLEKEERWK